MGDGHESDLQPESDEERVMLEESGRAAEAASHTPGPWSQGEPAKGDSDLMVYCDDATGQRIADCTNAYTFHSVDEKRANARLIAAAPDLLAALRGLVRFCEEATTYERENPHKFASYEAALAAIDKAEARS